jgi:hypothetical protein
MPPLAPPPTSMTDAPTSPQRQHHQHQHECRQHHTNANHDRCQARRTPMTTNSVQRQPHLTGLRHLQHPHTLTGLLARLISYHPSLLTDIAILLAYETTMQPPVPIIQPYFPSLFSHDGHQPPTNDNEHQPRQLSTMTNANTNDEKRPPCLIRCAY